MKLTRLVGSCDDGDGKYLGADFPDASRLDEFRAYRDTAMAHSVPFAEWWAQYGA
ncbi:hypothetical protein [Kitasatospora sp. NPDC056184]|uniref:hypothetical protein n=1 Tax=Kitasatospora sp. NPDC056184 TaxID=3345738 RepID=UPI0035E29FD2